MESRHDHVRVHITGDRRFKVGIKAAHLFGRLAYLSHLDDGRACLIVRSFFNNLSTRYIEEPTLSPGRWGDSVHVYNDGGALGGFGELECFGQTIGGDTDRTTSSDPMILWLYVGPEEQIEDISLHLLGVKARSGVRNRTAETIQEQGGSGLTVSAALPPFGDRIQGVSGHRFSSNLVSSSPVGLT